MELQTAEAEGQMKLGVGQLVRFCSPAQTPHCKPPWLNRKRASTGVYAAGSHRTAGVLAPSPLTAETFQVRARCQQALFLCCLLWSLLSFLSSQAQTFLHFCPLMTDMTTLWSSAIDRREGECVSGTSVWKILPYLTPCWTGHYNGVM